MIVAWSQKSSQHSLCRWMLALTIGAVCGAMVSPVIAQKRSPEIRAQENSDPAAGEVVIINPSTFEKRKGTAPNPYAPIKLNPLTDAETQARTKATPPPEPSSRPKVTSVPLPKLTANREKKSGPRETLPIPPLPERATNAVATRTDALERQDRLKQFPPPHSAANPRDGATSDSSDENRSRERARAGEQRRSKAQREARERRERDERRMADRLTADRATQRRGQFEAEERDFQRQEAERRKSQRRQRETVAALREREAQERRRSFREREWQDDHRFRDRYADVRRHNRRGRPWRMCRRLAWGCRDGFRRDCRIWRRRCSW